jgi:hypothetical protein
MEGSFGAGNTVIPSKGYLSKTNQIVVITTSGYLPCSYILCSLILNFYYVLQKLAYEL